MINVAPCTFIESHAGNGQILLLPDERQPDDTSLVEEWFFFHSTTSKTRRWSARACRSDARKVKLPVLGEQIYRAGHHVIAWRLSLSAVSRRRSAPAQLTSRDAKAVVGVALDGAHRRGLDEKEPKDSVSAAADQTAARRALRGIAHRRNRPRR